MLGLLVLAFAITVVVYLFNAVLPFKICALCAGISGTWLLATFAILSGLVSYEQYALPVLMFMAGTAAGISFQGEKKFVFARKSPWYWKIPSVFIGLPFFYWLYLKISWPVFAIEIVLLSFLFYAFFIRKNARRDKLSKEIKDLKQKLEDCC